ncbi:MAG TPA: hypothetical protein VG034_11805 [Acidimicrobiia bacterium]|nr:hypothetical protein [Acidimicrobiia bacterium]
MASGLQCPGCGHVHPAGLPEIARGDETFRCYGCYRMLSVPEGWTGRPSSRPPAPELPPTGDGPPGAGTRDARSARLAGRGRAGTLTGSSTGAPAGGPPTQMVPPVAPAGTAPASATAPPGTAAGATARRPAGAPLGWVAPRRSGRPLPTPLRVGVWVAAFVLGLVVSAFVLRKVGVLSVNTAIDLYAGSGLGRFGILLVLLPLWAVLSALIAHFSLEGLAKRRDARAASPRPPATTP